MDKLLEKLGLFDLWTTLFPGMVFLTLLKSTSRFFDMLSQGLPDCKNVIDRILAFIRISVYIPDTANKLLIFCLLSYCAGLIIHELSSGVRHHLIYRNGAPNDLLFEQPNVMFCKEQHNELLPKLLSLTNQAMIDDRIKQRRQQSHLCFQKVNTEMQKRKSAEQYAKLNVVYNECSALSLGLTIVLGIAVCFTIGLWVEQGTKQLLPALVYIFVLGMASGVLAYKSHKYFKYWVKNMVITFCYSNDKQSKGKSK